jgi:hypothetical protein
VAHHADRPDKPNAIDAHMINGCTRLWIVPNAMPRCAWCRLMATGAFSAGFDLDVGNGDIGFGARTVARSRHHHALWTALSPRSPRYGYRLGSAMEMAACDTVAADDARSVHRSQIRQRHRVPDLPWLIGPNCLKCCSMAMSVSSRRAHWQWGW